MNSLRSQQDATKVDWKAKTVKKLADKIKAQVDTTQGAITRLTQEISSAITEASLANKDAKDLLRMGAIGKPRFAGGPGGPGGPGPAGAPGAAPAAPPAGYAPGAVR